MKNRFLYLICCLLALTACKQKRAAPSSVSIDEIQLKQGPLISCGAANNEFGSVAFTASCSGAVKEDFNLAVALLHSFEYDEAEKLFAKVISKEPDCAMAYWGVAMANFHPLWAPPSEAELKKGNKVIQIAQSLDKSKEEAAYINAIAAFYKNWQTVDHHTRTLNFEKAMENIYTAYPADKEAAILYSLALDAAADPADKSFSKQIKAGKILEALYPGQPHHPGIVHYLIHTYDFPEMALKGLEAARKYAQVAPSSAHARHMPSHIFTRLGYWDECIQSNEASIAAAKCYAEQSGIKGHWDEELHGLDYLVYAFLQKGENDAAKKQWDYLESIKEINPANFKVAYAFAAIPSRYVLENKMWTAAAGLTVASANFTWDKFPWQNAIIHFTRLLGSIHTNNTYASKQELQQLNDLQNMLINKKDSYTANQVAIQIKAGEAWIKMKEGKNTEALALMRQAADMEDRTEKHPVTPCEVVPAKELLADMLFQMNKPADALKAYEEDLHKHPNRFNGLYGAGLAAFKSGNSKKAKNFFTQLVNIAPNSKRAEIAMSRKYLQL